ncbi:T9SS type A sorting domain-containing protein [Flammeovirga aprica]|uniref:T9SS type A sorting domain-containing protein n=1 Tax=Flammeovirga aprica JL-4 TaxID=694437 RepID=A0A7X9RXA4_9BACT|nr:T9SS type A sorting domain-containing protein [Flammeovirga aprica]NME70472.1 T9SS type A sorting domain-containing protein [Flammeovirga aprica JL-4]
MNALNLNCLYLITVLFISFSQAVSGATFRPNAVNEGTAFFYDFDDWKNTDWVVIDATDQKESYPTSGDIIQFGNSGEWKKNAVNIQFDLVSEGITGLTFTSNSNGSELTIGSSGVVNATTISGNNKVTITVSSGGSLTVTSAVSITNDQSVINNDGTLNFQGGLTFPGGGSKTFNNTGNTYITGDFTMSSTDLNVTAGSFNISGDWIIPDANGNSYNAVEVASGASMTVGGSIDFVNQAIIGDLSSKIQISGTFTAGSGCDDGGSSVCETIEASGGLLPVELISLFGLQTEDGFLMKWSTASEQNSSHFIIEGSDTKNNWKELAEIDGQGNTTVTTDYEFLIQPSEYKYYRLVQYDLDDSYEILGVLNNEISNGTFQIQAFPNEVIQGQPVHILFSNSNGLKSVVIQLFNLNGEILKQESLSIEGNSHHQFMMPVASNNGFYILSVMAGKEKFKQKVLMN